MPIGSSTAVRISSSLAAVGRRANAFGRAHRRHLPTLRDSRACPAGPGNRRGQIRAACRHRLNARLGRDRSSAACVAFRSEAVDFFERPEFAGSLRLASLLGTQPPVPLARVHRRAHNHLTRGATATRDCPTSTHKGQPLRGNRSASQRARPSHGNQMADALFQR